MFNDFIPRTDAGLLEFATQFSTKISLAPTSYGLSAGNATAYAAAKGDFATKYAVSIDPVTRGRSTIFAKDQSRVLLVVLTRQFARQIQGTMTVTNQQRLDLGLTVRNTEPTPVPVPAMAPGIQVKSVDGRVVTLRIFDPENPTRRARPAGVAGVSLFSYVGATAPEDPAEFKFEGSVSRMTFEVTFPITVAAGAKVWITGFFFNPRALSGPACEPVSAFLQFGGDMPMAA